jgi:hypothetical protein
MTTASASMSNSLSCPTFGEAHGQTFAMTFEPEDAERIGLELVRRARALAAVPLAGDAQKGSQLGE